MKTPTRAWLAAALALGLAGCTADSTGDRSGADLSDAADAPEIVRGEYTPFDGYTLFHPLRSTSVYLVDMEGELVHQWKTEYNSGQSVYLLDNGNILRAARDPDPAGPYRGGGEGGIIQEIAPDSTVVWEHEFSDEDKRHHHDIEPMPNGNVLLIAWEGKTLDQAIAAGINPDRMQDEEIWPDYVVEVEPVPPDGANIVWEWHVWDHLVQEHDSSKDNYGVVAEHPELIDINSAAPHRERQDIATPEAVAQLEALGYLDAAGAVDNRPEIGRDWLHTNSIAYNAELDQILLSARSFSEIWIIDHSTTTEEAAGHTSGRWGKGGDLLYRWGNPEAHGAGVPADRQLFVQHDARWIPEGSPGAGNITIFNNGSGRPEPEWSSVDEIVPPTDTQGHYVMEPGQPTGPETPVWTYTAEDKASMYANFISGANRLPNGNTLIGLGPGGHILEVGANNQVVWEYRNPYIEDEGPQAEARERRDRERGAQGERGGRAAGGGRRGTPREGARGGPGGDAAQGGGRGPGGGGGGSSNEGNIYRATRIPPDHPGLARVLAAARPNQQ